MSKAKPHARLGEQIDRLVRALALTKGWRIGRSVAEVAERTDYAEATVYRWRQGRLCPPEKALENLIRMGEEEAGLDRIWGESLLRAACYPDATRLVDEIWGLKEIRPVPTNLPYPGHTVFVGRQAEMVRLMELLSPAHQAYLISVDGIGGVGKTALVLEAAYRCLRASTGEVPSPRIPTFDAIVFASAKQQFLTPGGILARQQAQRTLRDIFHEIAHTLGRLNITHATPEEQPDLVQKALIQQRTLLIVDNLETVEDQEAVLSFLYDLPRPTKAVVTTRHRVVQLLAPIRMENLPERDGLDLITCHAEANQVTLTQDHALDLYHCSNGIPAAIVYAVGQIAAGHSAEAILDRVSQARGDVARFCFEGSVTPLQGQPAHYLLMALAMFPKRPLREAVIHVAGLTADPIAADNGLARLRQLSLVSQREGRYTMLSLTREYALAELAAHPHFEREARERWVAWYLKFTQDYGGSDWENWHVQYDRLEEEWENLLAVFDWCAAQERYDNIRAFWQEKHVDDFSNVYGCWDDRLIWSEWLIEAAERRGDWPSAVRAMSDKIWTLAMMAGPRQLEEAEALLEPAWSLRDHASPKIQFDLARNIAVFYSRKGERTKAFYWLDQAEALLVKTDLEEREHIREQISPLYWRAVMACECKDHDQAEPLFLYMVKSAQTIGWQRAVIYAQNWLADIAIARNNLGEAERLLRMGLPVAERNKDKRRTAFYKCSFARLERARGNLAQARRWAEEALDGFDRLGMEKETGEMRDLLAELGCEGNW